MTTRTPSHHPIKSAQKPQSPDTVVEAAETLTPLSDLKSRNAAWLTWLGVSLAGLLLGLGLLATWWLWTRHTSSNLNTPPANDPEVIVEEVVEPSFTVVLLGYGGAGHAGSGLTDSILVAHLLLEQKRVILLSLPRDLWVQATNPDQTQSGTKLNAVKALWSEDQLKSTLSAVTGWSIDRYLAVDFQGFIRALDTFGGIELTVDRSFDDYEYPITGRENLVCEDIKDESGGLIQPADPAPTDGATSIADEIAAGKLDRSTLPENVQKYPCRYEHLHFDAGRQTLTGTQALKYARSRHAAQDGNDFNRARRQQNLILSFGQQLFARDSLSKIPGLVSSLRGNIQTDLSALEIAEWLARAPEVRSWPITSLLLTDKNYLRSGVAGGGQYVLEPQIGEFQWTQIKAWLKASGSAKPEFSDALVEVQTPASARLLAEQLEDQVATSSSGLARVTVTMGNTRNASASAQIQPLVPGIPPATLEFLQAYFSGTLDITQQASTAAAANWNGPHIRVIWR